MNTATKPVRAKVAVTPAALWTPEPKGGDLEPLNQGEQAVYDALSKRLAAGRGVPTRKELAVELGLQSTSSVNVRLRLIEAKGWIQIGKGKNRSITLAVQNDVPLLQADGRFALDRALDPGLDAVGRIPKRVLERLMPAPDMCVQLAFFGMNVRGLASGETVGIVTGKEPEDGDIVILRWNGWFQCRAFRRVDERIVELIEMDSEAGPLVNRINCDKGRLEIEGVVVGSLSGIPILAQPWYRQSLPMLRGERD